MTVSLPCNKNKFAKEEEAYLCNLETFFFVKQWVEKWVISDKDSAIVGTPCILIEFSWIKGKNAEDALQGVQASLYSSYYLYNTCLDTLYGWWSCRRTVELIVPPFLHLLTWLPSTFYWICVLPIEGLLSSSHHRRHHKQANCFLLAFQTL